MVGCPSEGSLGESGGGGGGTGENWWPSREEAIMVVVVIDFRGALGRRGKS